jgi:siroheme synthase-like protein
MWLAVAAATSEVNREVAAAAERLRIFVNAVDDPPNATAYLSGVIRRDDVTIAVSTSGEAPALTALVREALDAVLPSDLDDWMRTARSQRRDWKRDRVAMDARKPLLLNALNALYENRETRTERPEPRTQYPEPRTPYAEPRTPWLSSPEDSWL